MELIVIKTGKKYIRCKEGEYFPCPLEKASVFPLERLEHVRGILAELEAGGFTDLCLRKLIVTEEPFIDDLE